MKGITQQQIEKIRDSKEFNHAAFYLGGIYQLLSVIFQNRSYQDQGARTT